MLALKAADMYLQTRQFAKTLLHQSRAFVNSNDFERNNSNTTSNNTDNGSSNYSSSNDLMPVYDNTLTQNFETPYDITNNVRSTNSSTTFDSPGMDIDVNWTSKSSNSSNSSIYHVAFTTYSTPTVLSCNSSIATFSGRNSPFVVSEDIFQTAAYDQNHSGLTNNVASSNTYRQLIPRLYSLPESHVMSHENVLTTGLTTTSSYSKDDDFDEILSKDLETLTDLDH